MVSLLVSLLVVILVLALIYYLLQMLPIDPRFKNIITIIFIIIAILVLLRFAFPGVVTL